MSTRAISCGRAWSQFDKLGAIMDRPPIVLSPYDADCSGIVV